MSDRSNECTVFTHALEYSSEKDCQTIERIIQISEQLNLLNLFQEHDTLDTEHQLSFRQTGNLVLGSLENSIWLVEQSGILAIDSSVHVYDLFAGYGVVAAVALALRRKVNFSLHTSVVCNDFSPRNKCFFKDVLAGFDIEPECAKYEVRNFLHTNLPKQGYTAWLAHCPHVPGIDNIIKRLIDTKPTDRPDVTAILPCHEYRTEVSDLLTLGTNLETAFLEALTKRILNTDSQCPKTLKEAVKVFFNLLRLYQIRRAGMRAVMHNAPLKDRCGQVNVMVIKESD